MSLEELMKLHLEFQDRKSHSYVLTTFVSARESSMFDRVRPLSDELQAYSAFRIPCYNPVSFSHDYRLKSNQDNTWVATGWTLSGWVGSWWLLFRKFLPLSMVHSRFYWC